MIFMLQILEDVRDLEKRRTQLEQDSETTKKNLEQANKDLEAKEKALQAVSGYCRLFVYRWGHRWENHTMLLSGDEMRMLI